MRSVCQAQEWLAEFDDGRGHKSEFCRGTTFANVSACEGITGSRSICCQTLAGDSAEVPTGYQGVGRCSGSSDARSELSDEAGVCLWLSAISIT